MDWLETIKIKEGKKICANRDSNPGRVDGNDTSYPWTIRA